MRFSFQDFCMIIFLVSFYLFTCNKCRYISCREPCNNWCTSVEWSQWWILDSPIPLRNLSHSNQHFANTAARWSLSCQTSLQWKRYNICMNSSINLTTLTLWRVDLNYPAGFCIAEISPLRHRVLTKAPVFWPNKFSKSIIGRASEKFQVNI